MSGGSRGIGLAIAERLAGDGARVALIAKTDEPHPKLPGTIHTAAEAIEAAGGRGAADRRRRPRRRAGRGLRRARRRALRRRRHRRQQRERDQPRADRGTRAQALRPDARHQHPRHVPAHARRRSPTCASPTTRTCSRSARRSSPTRSGSRARRLHGLEDGDDDADARPRRRTSRARRRRQLPVAAHADRDRRGSEPARRRRGDGGEQARRRSTPTRPARSSARPARARPGTRASTTRYWPRPASPTSPATSRRQVSSRSICSSTAGPARRGSRAAGLGPRDVRWVGVCSWCGAVDWHAAGSARRGSPRPAGGAVGCCRPGHWIHRAFITPTMRAHGRCPLITSPPASGQPARAKRDRTPSETPQSFRGRIAASGEDTSRPSSAKNHENA